MPKYWIVLTLFLAMNMWLFGARYSGWNLFLHYTGLHGFFGDAMSFSINDSFWFITLILFLYGIFCAVHGLLGSPTRLLLVGSVISLILVMLAFYTGQSGIMRHACLRLPGFFIGLLVGVLMKEGHLEIKFGAELALAALLLTYVPYTLGIIFHSVPVGLAVILFYAFAWKRFVPTKVEQRSATALRFLGDYSLEIFLIHQPLIREYNILVQTRWLGETALNPGEVIVGMSVAFVATIVASVELRRLVARLPQPA